MSPLQVLLVLKTMGTSLVNLEEHLSNMAELSNKAAEVAEFLKKRPGEMETAREEDNLEAQVCSCPCASSMRHIYRLLVPCGPAII